jgi:hypothetical protein
VIEEEKYRVKTYKDDIRGIKELQEFAVQRKDSDMLSVISQAKVLFSRCLVEDRGPCVVLEQWLCGTASRSVIGT